MFESLKDVPMIELIEQNWPRIMDFMKNEFEMQDVSFNTWIVPMKPYRCVGETLYIIASDNPEIIRIVTKKYQTWMKVAVKAITGKTLEVVFICEDEKDSIETAPRAVSSPDPYREAVKKARLNPNYTFDAFVSGKSNELAHAAALAVAENPGVDYRILYIYGGVGLGKTHLMQAIAHYVLQRNPSTNVLYVSSETFTNDYIDSLKKGENKEKFRHKYRVSPDILLIDDIQFIAGKEGTQEEFFHTFNALYESNKQIVITSDKPPKDINNLEERIRSRFEGGLVVDIQVPDFETRMAILRKKEEMEGCSIDDEVIRFIAENIKSNIRILEGALHKLLLGSRLTKAPVSVEMARETLRDILGSDDSSDIVTPGKIISVVCDHFSLNEKDFLSVKKNKDISFPRQVAMYLCCEMTEASQVSIGVMMGGRDHSTIIHGRDRIAALMREDPQLRATINILRKKIES